MMTSSAPVFIDAAAIQQILKWKDLIEALASAYAKPIAPEASPPRSLARGKDASLRALVAVPPDGRFMGAKIFGRGSDRGMNYLISLAEQSTGQIRALIDGNLITAFRTAATSAVAVDRLAHPDASILGVIGSGAEARAHVEALCTIRPIRQIYVYSHTSSRREEFAQAITNLLGIQCTALTSADDVTDQSDIVVAAARSYNEQPVLNGARLRSGMTVVSVGSTLPEQREIDVSVVQRCDLIVCDSVEEVSNETGDMLAARNAQLPFSQKTRSLNDLVMGCIAGGPAQIPLFKSVGSALQDIVAAELVFDKAVAAGLAVALPISFLQKQ